MQTTTNYGYNVPESGDAADITKVSQNFVDIDSDLKEVADTVNNTCSDLSGKIDGVSTKVDGVSTKVDSIQTTVDTLPYKVEQKLDPVQTDMAQLVENVQKQVDELRTIVENSPAGVPAPALALFKSSSTDDGIKVTYKITATTNPYDLAGSSNLTDESIFPLAITKGVMVRYSEESYPTSEKDGILAFVDEDVYSVTSNYRISKQKSQLITGLTKEKTYYISAFPYTTNNVYNTSSGVRNGGDSGNRTKCKWTGSKGTLTVNVTQDYDYKPLGEYTVTMTPTAGGQAITKTQSGAATVVFSGLEAGEYTLSFSAPQYFTAPSSQSVTVVAGQSQTIGSQYLFTPPSLSEATWDEIDSLSSIASNFWSVGDTKDIVVNGETLTFEIIGFKHDDLSDGSGKAGITFCMTNLMEDVKPMTNSNYNSNSFIGTAMYRYLNDTIYNGIPSDLKNVIKEVNKKTGVGGPSSLNTQVDEMKLWLLSEIEVGLSDNSVGNEGSKYSKFTTSSDRIKKLPSGESGYYWWLRSPVKYNSYGFCVINGSGSSHLRNTSDYYAYGVCFGFCI